MRTTVVLSVFTLVVLACSFAWATPTNVIQMPTAEIVGDGEYNISVDNTLNFGTQTLQTLAGITYGGTEDFELGLDAVTNDPQGVYFNAKWRVTASDRDTHFAVGVWGVGPRFQTSPNVLYAVATLKDTDTDGGNSFNFHAGLYTGNRTFLGRDNTNVMVGTDFGDRTWRGYIDYISGNNPMGVFSVGLGYRQKGKEFGGKLAYQYWTRAQTSAVTLQLDYWTK